MESVLLFLFEIFLYPFDTSKGRKRAWVNFGCFLLALAVLALAIYVGIKSSSL